MALTNYTTLKAAIANFLARDDLTSEIDDFIDLTEADFNRRLRIRAMEANTAGFERSGVPKMYSIEGTNFRFSPTPDTSYTARLTFYKAFDSLSSTVATNHILTYFPDVYLYGALYYASTFIRGMDQATVLQFKTQYDSALMQLEAQDEKDKYNGSPLIQRADININNFDNVK